MCSSWVLGIVASLWERLSGGVLALLLGLLMRRLKTRPARRVWRGGGGAGGSAAGGGCTAEVVSSKPVVIFLKKNCGRRERTADCAGYVLGSAMWSLESFSERESSAVRNCLAKDI